MYALCGYFLRVVCWGTNSVSSVYVHSVCSVGIFSDLCVGTNYVSSIRVFVLRMLSVGVFSECVFCVLCVDVLHELWALSVCVGISVCITIVWELCMNMLLALHGHFRWAVRVDWHIPFHRKCCADSWSKEVIQLNKKEWLLCQSICITYMYVQNAWENFLCSSATQIQLQNDCTHMCVFDGGWREGLHARF